MKKKKWADFFLTVVFRFIGGTLLGCLACVLFTWRGVLRAFSRNHTHWPFILLAVFGLAGGIIAVCQTPYWQTPWYKGIHGQDDSDA
jgi:drug/metabolite transporter (DMT)-like permease